MVLLIAVIFFLNDFILDVRFMIRSSLLEITSNFKSGELQIQAAQVRQMIRALFSNTDHRQEALAKIHDTTSSDIRGRQTRTLGNL